MYFVDSTGHTFFQQSFEYEPIGYEFYQNKYTFWIDNKDHSYCSVNNYYIRPIYILLNEPAVSLEIKIDSQIFNLISSVKFAENFVKENRELNINEEDLVNVLQLDENNNDILAIEVNSSETTSNGSNVVKYMYPFYVIGNCPESGTFFTNVLVHATFETGENDWCPITVGGEFNDQNEILYINGTNMGVNLPPEIIRAVYNASYDNAAFDEDLYNEKLKEYLLEYMSIRGEIGNYKSAINSLKWFGWGNKMTIVSLLKTDNQFMTQFVRDYFDTESDILESFSNFINTTLLSLIVQENMETGRYNPYDLNKDFIGENQPELESLFTKLIPVKYGGVGEETYYYKTYYSFIFSELLFKIAALKYYYQKYFLPVHLSIHNASIHHKVYANDLKMLNTSNVFITEPIVKMGIWKDPFVEFPKDNEIWLTEQIHLVDELYNEWDVSVKEINDPENNKNYYYIHDTCGNIPIKFINYENENQMHVHMILEKLTGEGDNILYINKPINLLYDTLHIIDITNNEMDLDDMFISYSRDNGKTYSTYFHGIDTVKNILHNYDRKEIDVLYDEDGHYVNINDDKIYLTDSVQQRTYVDDYGLSYFVDIPTIEQCNVDLFNNIGSCYVTYYNNVLLRLRIENDRINSCTISNKTEQNITDDIKIMYSPSSEIFFEDDFIFNPSAAENYLSFVLYPKMFNNVSSDIIYNRYGSNLTNNRIDITYFINNRFRMRLLVNDRWHEYEFVVRIPDLQIEFGTLAYKYFNDELKFSTSFNQLNELTENTLQFNSYMHEPRLTRVNHINFLEDFLKYLKISSARYIDGNMIPTNAFYYYIDVNFKDGDDNYSQRIYITDDDYQNDIIIPRAYFDYDMIFYMFLDKKMMYIFGDSGVNNIFDILSVDSSALIFDEDNDSSEQDSSELYIDTNNYKKFIYNKDHNAYEIETSEGTVQFSIHESLRNDFNSFTSKYIETHNITNNYKYLNQIHVYDLYRLNEHEGINIITLQNNIDLLYHGIRFTHKSFLNGNLIHISGNVNNLITNSNVRSGKYADNKTFESSLDPTDEFTIYDSYINTYDDLVIYTAYEGDWLYPVANEEITPNGFVYYESVDKDGISTGEYTTNSLNIVEDAVQVTINGKDYKDFSTLNEFNEWLMNGEEISVDDNKYNIVYDADNVNAIYINRYNNDSDITLLYYTAELVKKIRWDHDSDGDVINPTYNEFCEADGPKADIVNNQDMSDKTYDYFIRIRLFARAHKVMNNIQRIYEGTPSTDEDGKYYITLNNNKIYLLPFYVEYDGNHDMLYNVKSLVQQPGIDWIDINDIDNTIYSMNSDTDVIEYINVEDSSFDINDYDDSDIESLLKHRKILILNVTSRVIEAIHGYENTLVFHDYILNLNNNNDEIKTVDLNFKIDSNIIDGDKDLVNVLTVVRCKRMITDENSNISYDYVYFDDMMSIKAILNYNDSTCNVSCGNIYDENGPYIDYVYENENGEQIQSRYVDFTVFFAVVPISNDDDKEFSIDINPKINIVYNDYDILEYPNDSFINVNYDSEDFINYKINDVSYKYGDCRKSKQIIDLYNEFFTKRTTIFNDEYQFTSIDAIDELNIDKNAVEYDMYLMHNTNSWYILYISKDTCNKSLALYDYEPISKEIMFVRNDHQYKLVHNTSVKKFLLNRYMYVSKNGKNYFNTDDIIVGKVLNNERLPIDIFKTNKWEIIPASIGINRDLTTSVSNIDMCIIDAPLYNNEYVKGYYDVTYRYSLDRISTQQYKKYGTIRIG